MTALLNESGIEVGKDRVQRIWANRMSIIEIADRSDDSKVIMGEYDRTMEPPRKFL